MAEARTLAEAYMYLELTLPPGESWVDYGRYTTLETVGDSYLLRFDGPYEGRRCTAEVTVPEAGANEGPGLSYGDGPSRLIDAGQWYAIEAGYAGMARAGLEELADPSGTQEQAYWATVEAWDAAAAAAREIEKFVPPDEEQVPADAFWTEQGRQVHAQRPDAFRRTRLVDARAHYLRQRDILLARRDAPGAAPAGELPELPVRGYGEAHVYMDLHPCSCGSAQFPRGAMSVLRADDEGVRVRYVCPCDHCGQSREFAFRLPARRGLPPESPYRFSYLADGPSEVVDPGEWLGVSDGYATVADAMVSGAMVSAAGAVPGWPDPGEREDLVKLLTCAASAVEEVLKFLPAGADALPESTLWTAGGREAYLVDPGEFERPRLVARQQDRWQRLDELIARYPLPS